MKEQVFLPRMTSDSGFDFSNFFVNKKRFFLYLHNEGPTIKTLKREEDFSLIQNDMFHGVVAAVYFAANNNIIHYDIKPTNMCYKVVKKKDTLFLDNLVASRSKIQKKKRFTFVKNQWIYSVEPEMKPSNKRSRSTFNQRKPKRMFTPTKRLKSKQMDVNIFRFNQKGSVHIKLIDFGLSKVENLGLFKYRCRRILSKYKKYIQTSRFDLRHTLIDPTFDVFQEIQSRFDLCDSKNTKQLKHASTFCTSDSFARDDDLTQYTSKINNLTSSASKNTLQRQPLQAEDSWFLQIEDEPKASFRDHLIRIFFQSEQDLSKYELSPEAKQQVLKIEDKLKKLTIRGTLKYASVLSMLKIDCEFLTDFESMCYTLIDLLSLFPKNLPQEDQDLNIFDSDLFRTNTQKDQDRKQQPTINHKTLFLKTKSFVTKDQLDLALFVLACTKKADFQHNYAGIEWLFKVGKSKHSRRKRKRARSQISPKTSHSSLNQEDGEWGRFLRLKSLTSKVKKQGLHKLFEIFNLKTHAADLLLIKLSLCIQLHRFPAQLKDLYTLFAQFFFQYLLVVMFSRKYTFVHKFCVLMILSMA